MMWTLQLMQNALNHSFSPEFFFTDTSDSDTLQCFIIILLLILLLNQCKHCHWIMIALWFYATDIFQLMTEDLIYLELVYTGCKGQFVLDVFVKENPWGITVTVKYRWSYHLCHRSCSCNLKSYSQL